MFRFTFTLLVSFLLFFNGLYSQNIAKDSLINLLDKSLADTTRIDLLIKIANQSDSPQEKEKHLNRAHSIALKGKYSAELGDILYAQGYVYYSMGNIDKTIQSFEKALVLYREDNNKIKIANCYFNISNMLATFKNDVSGAISNLEKAYLIRDSLNLILLTCEAASRLAQYHGRIGELNKAEDYLSKTKSLLTSNLVTREDTLELVSFYSNAVAIYGEMQHLEKAKEYANESIKLQKILNDSTGLGIDLLNLGNVFLLLGQHEEAIPYYQEAIDIYKFMGTDDGMAHALLGIAEVRTRLGEYDKAIEYYKEAIDINKKEGNVNQGSINGLANCYRGIGKALIEKDSNNLEKGLAYFISADSIYKKIKNIGGQIKAGQSIGVVHYKKGEYFKAIGIMNEYLSLSRSINSNNWSVTALDALGMCYLKINDLKNSEKYLLLAESFVEKSKKLFTQKLVYGHLAELYENKQDFVKKSQYLEKTLEVKDSIYSYERNDLIIKHDRAFDSEKKEREILEKDLLLQKGQNQRNMLLFLTLFFAGLGVFYQSRVMRQKRLALVSQKTIEALQRKNQSVILENQKILESTTIEETRRQKYDLKKINSILDSKVELFDNRTYKFRDIVYFEKNDDAIHYFTMDGEFHPNTYGSLQKIHEELFPEPIFILVHRKYLINIYNVITYDNKSLLITMNDDKQTQIKIARTRKKEVLEKLDKYLNQGS